MMYEQWERRNLDCTGRYCGRDLRQFGFDYRQGDYVAPQNRIGAFMTYKWARAGQRLSRNLVGLARA